MYETILLLNEAYNNFAENHPIIMVGVLILFLLSVVSVMTNEVAKNRERSKMYK